MGADLDDLSEFWQNDSRSWKTPVDNVVSSAFCKRVYGIKYCIKHWRLESLYGNFCWNNNTTVYYSLMKKWINQTVRYYYVVLHRKRSSIIFAMAIFHIFQVLSRGWCCGLVNGPDESCRQFKHQPSKCSLWIELKKIMHLIDNWELFELFSK